MTSEQVSKATHWVLTNSTDVALKFHKVVEALGRKWMDYEADTYEVPTVDRIRRTIDGLCLHAQEEFNNRNPKPSMIKVSKNGIVMVCAGNDVGGFVRLEITESESEAWGEISEEEDEDEDEEA